MNAFLWTFTGLLVVVLILYIIAQVKNIVVMEKITRCFFVPFASGILFPLMAGYLPDSYHIILIFALAVFAYSLAVICTLSDKKPFIRNIEGFLVAAASIFWTSLLFSVYRIHKVGQVLFIILGIIYLAGFITICIFIKKQSFAKYLSAIIQYAINSFLSITAFFSLVYERRLFGFIMFIGTLSAMFYTVFQIFQKTRPFDISEKTEKIILTMVTLGTCIFMGTGALLMLYRP